MERPAVGQLAVFEQPRRVPEVVEHDREAGIRVADRHRDRRAPREADLLDEALAPVGLGRMRPAATMSRRSSTGMWTLRSKRCASARLTVLLPTAGAPTTRKMGAGFTLGP